MVVTRTSLLKGPMTSPAYTPPFARTFSARYAADLDTHTVGRDMIELAQEGSEEGFHFVCGAVCCNGEVCVLAKFSQDGVVLLFGSYTLLFSNTKEPFYVLKIVMHSLKCK
jgi:hypothetical protein